VSRRVAAEAAFAVSPAGRWFAVASADRIAFLLSRCRNLFVVGRSWDSPVLPPRGNDTAAPAFDPDVFSYRI
jgi:hypothetical protein